MSRKNVEDIYPLSPMQQGMLYHTLLASTSEGSAQRASGGAGAGAPLGVYFVQHRWTYRGTLDLAALARAWQSTVDRHPILRTAFVWERREEPLQVVRERVRLPIEERDVRALPPEARAAEVERLLDEDRRRGFDLAKAPLARVALIRLADRETMLVFSSHHMLLDGWSTQIVLRDVHAAYMAIVEGRAPSPSRVRPYADYIAFLQKQDKARREAFWRGCLQGFDAPVPIHSLFDRPADPAALPDYAQARLAIGDDESARIAAAAREQQITLSTLVEGAFGLLLARYAGVEDVVFGGVVSGRGAAVAGIEEMVGLFINTVPVRVQVDPSQGVNAFLKALQTRLAETREHEHAPLFEVQGYSNVPRGTPLFDSLFVFENYPVEASARAGITGVEMIDIHTKERTDYPVTFIGSHQKSLLLRLTHDRRRVSDEAAARIVGHWAELVRALAFAKDAGAGATLGDLDMMPLGEHAAVTSFSGAPSEYPRDTSIAGVFEREAAARPKAVALVSDTESLSYEALDARADALAQTLLDHGVTRGDRVGVWGHRSNAMIIATLAALKAEGAYVPLDPDLPASRLDFIREDAGVTVVVATDPVPEGVSLGAVVIPYLGGEPSSPARSADRPSREGRGGDLAYVMYTSGSTGTPKGAMIPQRAVVRLVKGATYLPFGPDLTFAQISSPAFDASTLEIWGPLLNGGTLVVPPQGRLSLDAIGDIVSRHGVTTLWLTSGLFNAMIESKPEGLRPLRHLLTGGEALSVPHVNKALAELSNVALFNGYGPTENTTFTTCHRIEGVQSSNVSIGKPISNTRVYLLDERLRPVPIGVPGELYAGGDGVGIGYVNRPELTAERFLKDPFAEGRMYKTGDVAKWASNGTITFVGRRDHQVKIRGFRVELGEIEAAIAALPRVREVVVLAREDTPGNKRLCAYVVAESDVDRSELGPLLAQRLPEYMVPSAFVVLDAMPLNQNGKVNRAALPAPDEVEATRATSPLQGPIEEAIAGIFAEVLKVPLDEVGADTGFFELGGHSISATQAVARLRAAFSIELPLSAVFASPAVRDLAAEVGAMLRGDRAAEVPGDGALRSALSFAEERLWFLAQLDPDDPSYNVPLLLRVRGALDEAALGRALDALAARHSVLRTSYRAEGGSPRRVIADQASIPLTSVRVADEREAKDRAAKEAETPFNLARGPLFRAFVYGIGERDHLVLLLFHHIVVDAWSLDVLYRELGALYQGKPLPPLATSYERLVQAQRAQPIDRAMDYWRARLGDAERSLALPSDHLRKGAPSHRGSRVSFSIPSDVTRALRAFSRREGATAFMTLLAAFDAVLHRWSGQGDISVGTPIAGRSGKGAQDLIGLFLNTLVVRVELTGAMSFRDLVGATKEACLGAYAHDEVPFERLVEELDPARDPGRSPLFQANFSVVTGGAPPSVDALAFSREPVPSTTAKYDLTLIIADRQEGLEGLIEFASDRFEASTILRMAEHYTSLLGAALRDPAKPIGDLPMMSDAERDRVLTGFNKTAAPIPDGCAHELFEEIADRAPDALAMADGDRRVTFAELDRMANRLAGELASIGVGPDDFAGICLDRSIEGVAAMLAAWKLGAAYVALDPAHPTERVIFAARDTKMKALVCAGRDKDRFAEAGVRLVHPDEHAGAIAARSSARPNVEVDPASLAYVIYTSGSTGTPKGVEIHHRGLMNMCAWHARAFSVTPADRTTHLAAPGFDATVGEIWPFLLAGASVHVIDDETRNRTDRLMDKMIGDGITIAFLPTPIAEIVLGDPKLTRGSIRALYAAGDRLSRRQPKDAPFRFYNLYGPTEYTMVTTIAEVDPAGEGPPPIGRPVANTSLYVVDARLHPVPIGVPGELLVSGVGVARGYLNRPDLAAQKFIADPFRAGERCYRTGDLVRWLPDGQIEFLGRIDDQVKIRGQRIELGEIEGALLGHPNVREAAVVAFDGPSGKELAAYVVLRDASEDAASLRGYVEAHLPSAMVPAAFVALASLPLTQNGKVDRKKLPKPVIEAAEHVAPRTETERVIAAIFADVLKRDRATREGGVATNVDRVGATDRFFALGGHSLLATIAIARVEQAFGVSLALRTIFDHDTPAALAVEVEAARSSPSITERIARADRAGDLPLSFGQERLFFLDQLDPGDAAYIVPMAMRVEGPLDAAALGRAFDALVARHEVLRTTFAMRRDRAVQVIHASVSAPFRVHHASEAEARAAIDALVRVPFDLVQGPVARADLFVLGERDHLLLLTMHHVVADAWTHGVILRDLFDLYAGKELPPLAIQYADFAAWQRARLDDAAIAAEIAYWKGALAGAPPALELPSDRPRPPVASRRGDRLPIAVPAKVTEGLRAIAQREGATLFMVLLAAFDVLLHRYTGEREITVGAPIAGRTRPETEPLIGFFVNTLALKVSIDDEAPFAALVRAAKETSLGAYAHQELPFERLVPELAAERDMSRTPIFQVMLALQNAGDAAQATRAGDLVVRPDRAASPTSKFDMTLGLAELDGALMGSIEYATDLFDASTIERTAAHLTTILAAVAADPSRTVASIPLLPEAEIAQIASFAGGSAAFASDACVHERFEQMADKMPDAPAVTFASETLTYRELDARANKLAHHLRALGVGPDTLVGLCIGRSIAMMVGLLGILKAGGAYLPLDPDYPHDRLAFMVEDAAITVLVTDREHEATVPHGRAEVVRLDADAALIDAQPSARPTRATSADNLVYCIYTSGSTGKPKGALLTHRNVVRLFDATDAWYRFGPRDVWTMFHSYAFDFSVWEIWGALFYGGRVVVVPYWVSRSPDAFYKLLCDERVTVLNQTPSAFRQLVRVEESVAEGDRVSSLRFVIFGGEALDLNDLRPWWDRHGDAAPQLVNMYGITETTVHVTYRPVNKADLARPWSSVIGVPIPDLSIVILDAKMRQVPIGVPGEMYVGGAGVAKGYLSRPELTAARFLQNPFGKGTLYKTGDVARYRPKGDIEYLGRSDHQVKIRGFRIELGEIEAALTQIDAIHECAVVARADGGDKRLVAYVVLREGARATVVELRAALKATLPDYMVPAVFVTLPKLPVTASGKLDRRALPAPEDAEAAEQGGEIALPATNAEEALAQIWADVLRLKRAIGVNENFFEIGGDSILSLQIVARAEEIGLVVTPRQIFQHPTIEALAAAASSIVRAVAEQGPVTGPLPMLPIVRWWLAQAPRDRDHYNQAFFLQLAEPADARALGRAVEAILTHHDALRVRLRGEGDTAEQWITAPGEGPPSFEVVALDATEDADLSAAIEAHARRAQESLRLEEGPVLRALLFTPGRGRPDRLLLAAHHLAVDGVSWRVIFDDLWSAYAAERRGDEVKLPRKTTSVRAWAERVIAYAKSDEALEESAYWLAEARSRARPLPVDHAEGRDHNLAGDVAHADASLTAEETEALLRKAPEAYQTQINDLLVTPLAEVLSKLTSSNAVLFDMEAHGRETDEISKDLDLSRTVGWLTAIYPVLVTVDADRGPGAAIKSIKEQLRAVPKRGVGYGMLRYLRGDDVSAALAAQPRAEIAWNYLGQLDQALPEDAPFRWARESAGPPHGPTSRRSYLIDVTAGVSKSVLSVRFSYGARVHDRATIEALAQRYVASLRALLAHCLSPEAGGYTPSDFQEEGLSQEAIDMIVGADDEDE